MEWEMGQSQGSQTYPWLYLRMKWTGIFGKHPWCYLFTHYTQNTTWYQPSCYTMDSGKKGETRPTVGENGIALTLSYGGGIPDTFGDMSTNHCDSNVKFILQTTSPIVSTPNVSSYSACFCTPLKFPYEANSEIGAVFGLCVVGHRRRGCCELRSIIWSGLLPFFVEN